MSDETTIPATVTPYQPLEALQQKINEYEETIKQQAERLDTRLVDYRKLQTTVYNFFADQFDGNDEEITVTREEANDLLGDIGADLLKQEFEGRVTISYSFTVKAESIEDAEEKVKNAVGSLEYSIDADADDEYSEESIEVEF